jgi:nucleobase transporter 1/2
MQFNGIINTVFASSLTVALSVASVQDNTLEFRGYESDRGL